MHAWFGKAHTKFLKSDAETNKDIKINLVHTIQIRLPGKLEEIQIILWNVPPIGRGRCAPLGQKCKLETFVTEQMQLIYAGAVCLHISGVIIIILVVAHVSWHG